MLLGVHAVVSPTMPERFLFRATPRPGYEQAVFDALVPAAQQLSCRATVELTTEKGSSTQFV